MDQPDNTPAIATELTSSGATVYMTKGAITELIVQLTRIAAADPEKGFEVHLGLLFSRFDKDDVLHQPPVLFGDGLGPVVKAMREVELQEDIANGKLDDDVTLAPFEVTLMHVPADTIEQMAEPRHKS